MNTFSKIGTGVMILTITFGAYAAAIECPICKDSSDMIQLDCGHAFCRECLREGLLEIALDANNSESLQCPNPQCLVAGRANARTPFTDNDIRRIAELDENPQATWDRYNEIKFREFVRGLGDDARRCPTPNCRIVWIFEPGDGKPHAMRWVCPDCNQARCINCLVDWNIHKGHDCQQARTLADHLAAMNSEVRAAQNADRQFSLYMARNEGIICLRCQTPIQKMCGSDHMVCGRDALGYAQLYGCGYEFCYRCLLPWEDHRADGYCDFFGGKSCSNALQKGLQQQNPWALELQNWINQDPVNHILQGIHRDGPYGVEIGGRTHYLELCKTLGIQKVRELFSLKKQI